MAGRLAGFLCPEGYAGPKGLRPLIAEARVVREAAHLACGVAQTAVRCGPRATRRHTGANNGADNGAGTGQPVLLVPGFLAGDLTLAPLAGWLRSHGYRTYRAQIRSNVACTREAAERLEARVADIAERRGRPVALIGHSLGGLLAKSVATRRPRLVHGLVTLGSPLLAPGAVHMVLKIDLAILATLSRAGLAAAMGTDCIGGQCAQLSWSELHARPLRAPFTSIYSTRDGIVDWRSCLDPDAVHVDVGCSHVGMAVDRGVWRHVVTALAAMSTGEAALSTGEAALSA